jgi:HD-GYP domain-containing protein (c-di-GMP phosphodiesterase class II)
VCCAEKAGGQAFDERDLRRLVSLAPHLAVAIENARFHEALQSSAFSALCTLAESVEARDGYMRGHAQRVADYATRAARELGLSPEAIHTLGQAARVHDIGRAAVSDTILGRSGPLTDEERAIVREHPLRGQRILQSLGFLEAALPIVRHHHERWDGKGYPDGLAGRGIDRLTRILTMADVFDAMTSPRPHRQAKSRDDALVELAGHAGAQFDPNLVEPFQRAVAGMA